MDAREVTNKQFKAFVDAGGYRTRRFWQVPFVDNGERPAGNRRRRGCATQRAGRVRPDGSSEPTQMVTTACRSGE